MKTTTSSPSDALLAATDRALGAEADVKDDERLLANVSTVDFDEVVPADVAEDAAAEISRRTDVVWASPNRLRQVQTASPVTPNDPAFGFQWNLWNPGYSTSSKLSMRAYGGYSIKAPALWRKTEGSPSTVVAVIDTGILTHPDLPEEQLVDGADLFSRTAFDNDGELGRDDDPRDPGDWFANGQCPFWGSQPESSWHGTFVAGQIAAATGNGSDIAAVAPGVRVQPIRALGRCGGWDDDIVAAMKWAAGIDVPGVSHNAHPAQVVNLSLAGPPVSARERELDCRVYNAAARLGKARGTIYVAAAGNDGDNANRVTPASCSELVSVGATSINGFRAVYSNVGSTVDLSAPGGDPWVDPYRGSNPKKRDVIWSLGNAGTRQAGAPAVVAAQGTSMAAPQVAGAAALLHSLGFTTPGSLKGALLASVSPFRARSKAYAKKEVFRDDFYDLNCTAPGPTRCGRGLLDLSRVQAPLSPPVIRGSGVVGEPLTTSLGTWVRKPSPPTYAWRAGGSAVGKGAVYWPTRADIGQQVTVTIAPSLAAFARLTTTSAAVTVADGPAVTLAGPSRAPTYGSAFWVTAQVPGAAPGQVELRTDEGRVVASGTVGGGTAVMRVPGRALKPGTPVRAAYLGDGTTPAASSPRRVLPIKKLSAKVSTRLRTTVRTTSRARLTIRVIDTPNVFAHPTGELRIYDGKRRIRITRLSSTSGGRKTIRLPRLTKGTHRIRVYFRDSDYITSTYSVVRRITAR